MRPKKGYKVTIIVEDDTTCETRTFFNTTQPETTHEYDYLGVERSETRFNLRLEAYPNSIKVIELVRTEVLEEKTDED